MASRTIFQCDKCEGETYKALQIELILLYNGHEDKVKRDLCPSCYAELVKHLGRAGKSQVQW